MTSLPLEFFSGAVAPVECLKIGWDSIKDHYWLFLGITLVAMLIGGAVPVVLIGPMMCGLYLCLLGKMRGEQPQFELLFKGFDYFVPGLIAAVIQVVPALALMLPAYVIFLVFALFTVPPHGSNEAPPVIFFVILIFFVIFAVAVGLVLNVLFLLAYPLIVDRKLSGWEAIKTSARAAMKNFGGLLGLVLLNAGLAILGVLACYVGLILILPISFASYAAAYRQVFPDTLPSYPPAPPPPPGNWAA